MMCVECFTSDLCSDKLDAVVIFWLIFCDKLCTLSQDSIAFFTALDYYTLIGTLLIRVYFRPLKKGVVLPLAIVKRGRATPLNL